MTNVESTPQLIVVANTGPMISAFQSGCIDLLRGVFKIIYVVPSTMAEYEKHGASDFISPLIDSGLVMIVPLSAAEQENATTVAQQIAASPLSRDPVAAAHIPDAETIVLAQRLGSECNFVMLDEMAAREVATRLRLRVTGFLGTLRFAYLGGLVTVEEVEKILLECRRQGTHYSRVLIRDFCKTLREK